MIKSIKTNKLKIYVRNKFDTYENIHNIATSNYTFHKASLIYMEALKLIWYQYLAPAGQYCYMY